MAKKSEAVPEFVDNDASAEEDVEYKREEDVVPETDPDADLPEDVKALSKKDLYERLAQAQKAASTTADPVQTLTPAFDRLTESLKAAIPQAPSTPTNDDKDFENAWKDNLFNDDKSLSTVQEAARRAVAPLFAQQQETTYTQALRIMELDPESGTSFKKYKTEVLNYAKANFPPGVQRTPQALEVAFKQVYASHIEEIAQDRANVIIEAERKKIAEGQTVSTARTPFRMEMESSSARTAPARKTVIITKADERESDERGVPVEWIVAHKGAK